MDTDTTMGPQSNATQYRTMRKTLARLQAAGGTVHSTTPVPTGTKGYYLAPAIVTGCAMEDCLGECFGPVCTMFTFDTPEQAVAMANRAPGMLQTYVYGRDVKHASAVGSQLHAGLVMINGVGFGFEAEDGEPSFSFWGRAGLGSDGPLETLVWFFGGNQVVGQNGSLPAAVVVQPRRPEHEARELVATPSRVEPHRALIPQRLNFRQRLYYRLNLDVDRPPHATPRHARRLVPPALPAAAGGGGVGGAGGDDSQLAVRAGAGGDAGAGSQAEGSGSGSDGDGDGTGDGDGAGSGGGGAAANVPTVDATQSGSICGDDGGGGGGGGGEGGGGQ